MFSPKVSSENGPSKSPTGPPPPYEQSAMSPLIVAETRLTRTEVVTRTTTETTTHLFSLANWRKRNGSRPSLENDSSKFVRRSPSRPLLVDKALPPTPPNERRDSEDLPKMPSHPPSPLLLPQPGLSRNRKLSATALVQAGLGLGLPHASSPLPNIDTNTVTFVTAPTPVSPASPSVSAPSPRIRRVKSSQRLDASLVESPINGDQLAHRRRRGFSFGGSSFLNLGVDNKGKAKEPEGLPAAAKSSPKALARKSSFWTKKKNSQSNESNSPLPPEADQVLTLSSLPPVHVSPFDAEFMPVPPLPAGRASVSSTAPALPRPSVQSRLPKSPTNPTTASPRPSVTFPIPSLPIQDAPAAPRPRNASNSPLLHRLSMGVFSSPDPSPSPTAVRSNAPNHHALPGSPVNAVRKVDTPIPKPLGDSESPEIYLSRLKSQVNKAEVAGILASSSDAFHARALRAYLEQFDFAAIPLDVALRKLLMEVGLPRETQQIDRVMEGFAFRYCQCNLKLFTSDDHPYILAFSLIMLHTDAFNPSNKRKMTKVDYIKNTKLPGIPVEVLDCFFDNIVFAPFIFIEDPVDFNGQPGISDLTRSSTTPISALPSSGAGSSFKIGNRVDPYYLIMNNLLDPLRVAVDSYIPTENPFSYEGTNGPWDEPELHDSFMKANVVNVEVPAFSRSPAAYSLSPGGMNPLMSPLPDVSDMVRETWNLKITKVGLLNRKDDLVEGGKKAMNRKWKTWSVILTGSQLLFCRDPTWAASLSAVSDGQQPLTPITIPFRPDELFSLRDAIAVYDRSYKKYNHTLRFVLPDGRHLLLQAADDDDLNQWISRINYASTFKTAGVKMRPLALSGQDALLTGVAAATSHLHDIEGRFNGPRPHSWGSNAPNDLMEMLTGQPTGPGSLRRRVTMAGGLAGDLEAPVSPEIDGAEQFKATFDQVKADLASGSWLLQDGDAVSPRSEGSIFESPPASPSSMTSNTSRLPSRSQIILSKIRDLDSKMASLQSQLESDERYARNIAILTPFRKTTRARLTAVIQGMARPVMHVRLEMEKLKCHRAVLRRDLISEGRSWNQSKRVALRVAKDTLQSRRTNTVPQMTLSLLDDTIVSNHHFASSDDFAMQLLKTPLSMAKPDTASTSGSFHSAKETGFDWSPAEDSTFFVPSSEQSNAAASSSSILIHSSEHAHDSAVANSPSKPETASQQADSVQSHQEGTYSLYEEDDEQAEEWNKTRVAHRVSLIQVPSDIVITTRLKGVAE